MDAPVTITLSHPCEASRLPSAVPKNADANAWVAAAAAVAGELVHPGTIP